MAADHLTIKQIVEENPGMKGFFTDSFYARLTLIGNRSKGSMHEKIAWAIVLKNAIEMLEINEPELILDRKIFRCFEQDQKLRRCDLFLEQAGIAYEVKSYRPILSRFVRDQIRKDEWLLKNKVVKQVWWLLFAGATPRVLSALTAAGIIYINVPQTGDDFTNIPQVYREEE